MTEPRTKDLAPTGSWLVRPEATTAGPAHLTFDYFAYPTKEARHA